MSSPRTLLATSLAALAAGLPAAQEKGGTAEQRVAAVVARIQHPADVAQARAELGALGPAALEPLFACLCAGAAEVAQSPQAFARAAATVTALTSLPREDVLAFLSRLARAPSDERARAAGLDLLMRVGGRNDLALALELAEPSPPDSPPGPELRAALESALLGIAARESGAPRALAGFFARAQPAAREAIVNVIGRCAGAEAPALLIGCLGGGGDDADALLLLALARLERPCADVALLERMRGYLGHPAERLPVLACLAVEKLRDHQAVPDLIVLLGDEDGNVRARAYAALRSLTGLTFTSEAEPWIAWLDRGLSWWDERAEPCRVALVSGPPAGAAAAVEEVAQQRLFVDQLAALLELGLRRPEKDVARSAWRGLGSMPGPVGPSLEQVAELAPALAAEASAGDEQPARPRMDARRSNPIHPPSRSLKR